jgi:hypothetical protein
MASAITSATQTQPVVQSATSSQKLPQSTLQPTSSSHTDTVRISSAGRAALEEATETSAQTAKEAHSGDRQAQKLLAKEADAAKSSER